MHLPSLLLKLLPMWDYVCPKCQESVPKNSHECPHCGESYLTAETLHELERIKLHRRSVAELREIALLRLKEVV